MASNKIRLQYSGFIIFAAKMLSIATGLAFTLMLTRTLKEQELGVWSNIMDMIAYFAFLAPAFPFWTMRFAARNKSGAMKTGVLANLAVSLVSTVIYLPSIPLIMTALGISQIYILPYLIASLQIIEAYLVAITEACLRVKAPQKIGYGLVIEESLKVALAYILIVKFRQPFIGGLLSITIAFGLQILYYLKLMSKELKEHADWKCVREWLKGSAANIYHLVGERIAAFTLIILIAYNPSVGQAARGIYQAATVVANIILYTSFLSFALYPKLLAENSLEDITISLKTVLMFAIPMTAGAIALSDSYLIILNEIYRGASQVLVILAVNAFIQSISQFFVSVLFGLEKIDEKAEIPMKKLVKGPLFKAFTLPYVHAAITLPTTYFALINLARDNAVLAASYVGLIDTLARIVAFIILYIILRKMVKPEIPWKSIVKYVFASCVMAGFLFFVPHPSKLSLTLSVTVCAGVIYIAIIALIDSEARELVRAFWHEVKFKIKGEI